MAFELTKGLLGRLRSDIANGRDTDAMAVMGQLHPADIGALLDRLNLDEARYLIHLLEPEIAADAIIELDEDRRERLLGELTSKEIAQELIGHIDSDDAADLMAMLPADKRREVISHLEDKGQKEDIEELLQYAEGTAGALMQKELVTVHADQTLARAIVEMRRQAHEVENLYTIYVVDREEKLYGVLSLKDLLFSVKSARTMIKHICQTDVVTVRDDEAAEVAVNRMKKYDVVVLPVVDRDGVLLGRITFDDAMDVMEEQAEEDYQLASGITEDVDASDRPLVQVRARLPWLLIGMAGGVLSSQIIAMYEEDLRIDPKMAFFMPLIAATAGNVGVQSSAIVVQGLAAGAMRNVNILGRLWRELSVGLLSAIVCGSLIFGVNMLLAQSQALSWTVSIALFTVIITAAFFGTLTPLVLDRLKVDPALATGPFVTTLNDIFGLLTYFTVGHFMYNAFP